LPDKTSDLGVALEVLCNLGGNKGLPDWRRKWVVSRQFQGSGSIVFGRNQVIGIECLAGMPSSLFGPSCMLIEPSPIVLESIFGVCEILFGFPAVFSRGAGLPPDQVVGLSFLGFVFQNSFNLIFLFSIDEVGNGSGKGWSMSIGPFKCG
jgi:hypothetical protein